MASRKSDEFYRKLNEICGRIGCDPGDLLTVMFFESGVKPDAVNPLSGATGLIQFMPSLLTRWGYSTADVKAMTDVTQLDLVERYLVAPTFRMRVRNLTDLYLAVFWPIGIGTADDYQIAAKGSPVYEQNKGLDRDGDGHITRKDIAAMIGTVATREEVKQLIEEYRLVQFIDSLPKDDAAERIARLVEYFGEPPTKPGPKLRALAARVESRPDAEMFRQTNCATSMRWIWAAAGCDHPLCTCPDEVARAKRPAGPVDWCRVIASDRKALRATNRGDVARGVGLRYFSGNNNDHMEHALATPDREGKARHGGGGRGGNAITVEESVIWFSMGRPIVETIDPWAILQMDRPKAKPVSPPPALPFPAEEPSPVEEKTVPIDPPITIKAEIPPTAPSAPAPAPKGSLLVVALAAIGVVAVTLFEVCSK